MAGRPPPPLGPTAKRRSAAGSVAPGATRRTCDRRPAGRARADRRPADRRCCRVIHKLSARSGRASRNRRSCARGSGPVAVAGPPLRAADSQPLAPEPLTVKPRPEMRFVTFRHEHHRRDGKCGSGENRGRRKGRDTPPEGTLAARRRDERPHGAGNRTQPATPRGLGERPGNIGDRARPEFRQGGG